jgi:hypothetical protein
MVTTKELKEKVKYAEAEINHIRQEQGKAPINLGVGGAYGRTYIYRGGGIFEDPLFSGTKKECEIFLKGFYYQRVLQNRNYGGLN